LHRLPARLTPLSALLTRQVLTKCSIPAENFPFCTIDPNNVRPALLRAFSAEAAAAAEG